MRSCWKFGWPAAMLCLCCIVVPLWGDPPVPRPSPEPTPTEPQSVSRAQNLVAVACVSVPNLGRGRRVDQVLA